MSKCKITGKVLVVQLGRDETRLALMGSGSEILHRSTLPTPVGAVDDGMILNADTVRDLLHTALAAPEYHGVHKVVFSLCTSQVIIEKITTPDIPAAKLDKLIQSNVDMYFPMDMKDYQLVWQTIGPKAGDGTLKELDVQLWAVPTAMLSRYYTVANACGLSVAAIDYCGHSIATAVSAAFTTPGKSAAGKGKFKLDLNAEISFGKKKSEATPVQEATDTAVAVEASSTPTTDLHLTLDSDLIFMTFVQNGQVVLQRPVQCGVHPSHQFGELAMMVEYFRSLEMGRGSEVKGILSGSLAGDSQLTAELADMLGISLTTLDAVYEPQWATCVGAARTTLDFGIPSLNRPTHARHKLENQIWQYALVLAGGAAVLLVLLITLSSRLIWNSSINSLESTKDMLTIQAAQTAGYADKYKDYASKYDKYSADWDTIFASLRTYNDNLVLVLKELEATLPGSSSVAAMQIAADGLTVQFACSSKEEAAYLIMALRELKYADLTAISNLSGGGGGPATSYGSGKTPVATEVAPTEGSYELTKEDLDTIAALMASQVTEEELMATALTLSPQQLELLKSTYGGQPESHYLSLAGFISANSITVAQRKEAVHEMLTTNPFAMELFATLLEEDTERSYEEALLWPYLLEDFMLEENQDMVDAIFEGTISDDPDVLAGYMERIVAMLIKDETTLTASENLFCTNSELEQWYIYYLEVAANLRPAEVYPYLDMDRVIEDLMNGGFNTTDSRLNKTLNDMIPDDVWDLLDTLAESENETLPGDYTEAELKNLLNKYLTTGTTGNKALDALIKKYMDTGSTGNPKWDAIIKDYMDKLTGGNGDSLGDLLDNILGGGNGGNGGSGGVKDTRIYFTVVLRYNEELINAELARKGLSYSDKLEKLEVAK